MKYTCVQHFIFLPLKECHESVIQLCLLRELPDIFLFGPVRMQRHLLSETVAGICIHGGAYDDSNK